MAPETRGVRYGLIATATILDTGFPDDEAWFQETVASNFGWPDMLHEPAYRIASNREDELTESGGFNATP